MRLNREAGDTIIEVMLAFTVFAMLAVGAIAIMNQGVASAQEALETTLVRQEIDGQADALRFLHQAYMINPDPATGTTGAKFKTIVANAGVGIDASPYGDSQCLTDVAGIGHNPFIINTRNSAVISGTALKAMNDPTAPAYAQLVNHTDDIGADPYGLWIEGVKGETVANQPKFIDFHIRACWYSVSNNAPRTLGTIVRLYYAS